MRHPPLTPLAVLGLVLVALAAPTSATQLPDLRSPDASDAAEGPAGSPPEVTVVQLHQPSPAVAAGVDWGDAGTGAGTNSR